MSGGTAVGRIAYVGTDDVLLLAEVTSPGNFRQDRIVKHGDEVRAPAVELVDGVYRQYATAPDGVLRLGRPWPLEADLRALARGR